MKRLDNKTQDYAAWLVGEKRLQPFGSSARRSDLVLNEVDDSASLFNLAVPLIVEHDWAALLRDQAAVTDGPFVLPFPIVLFQIKVSGQRLILAAYQRENNPDFLDCSLLRENNNWPHWREIFFFDVDRLTGKVRFTEEFFRRHPPSERGRVQFLFAPLAQYVTNQLRCACIALDAGIAECAARAGQNKRAASAQKLRPAAPHVVRPLRRNGSEQAQRASDDSGRRLRWHLRRGHWHTYITRSGRVQRWVRWQFVGDPDLGIVDKEYRL